MREHGLEMEGNGGEKCLQKEKGTCDATCSLDTVLETV